MEKIRGQQVTLRPAKPNDRQQIFQWLTQSDLTAQMLGPPLFPDAEIPTWEYFVEDYNPDFFSDLNPDNGRSFIIEVNNLPVGHINLTRLTGAPTLLNWIFG